MSVILMSIKPKWAKELYIGKKTVEFRKSAPPVGSLVYLYEGAPVGAVTGMFQVAAILKADAEQVWRTVRVLKGVWNPGSVTHDSLINYANGADGKCCAILAAQPWHFPESEWIKLEKFAVRPPQSWQTLRNNLSTETVLARALLTITRKMISGEVSHG
jgi:predicted transcriptional regulator